MSRQDDFDVLETYVAATFSKNVSKDMPSAEVLARAKWGTVRTNYRF